MMSRIWLPPSLAPLSARLLSPLTALALLLGPTVALAQTVGPDEAPYAGGAMTPKLVLTDAQKSAIYNAVLQQRLRGFDAGIPVAIGAPVSPTTELAALPDQAVAAAAADPSAADLKYAMVEDDVVVIDSITMRVVEVIHGSARP